MIPSWYPLLKLHGIQEDRYEVWTKRAEEGSRITLLELTMSNLPDLQSLINTICLGDGRLRGAGGAPSQSQSLLRVENLKLTVLWYRLK